MKNPGSLKIPILFLGLSLSGILTIAVPINDNQIFDGPKEISAIRTVDFFHNDHSISPLRLSYPPTSLSPRSLKGWTYRVITTHFLLPTKNAALEMLTDINATMHHWMNYVAVIDSYAPSSHIKLSYGDLRMDFWSPAPILWTVAAEIVKLHLLLGMMFMTLFSRVRWEYANAVAVVVLFYAMGNRPDGVIPV